MLRHFSKSRKGDPSYSLISFSSVGVKLPSASVLLLEGVFGSYLPVSVALPGLSFSAVGVCDAPYPLVALLLLANVSTAQEVF